MIVSDVIGVFDVFNGLDDVNVDTSFTVDRPEVTENLNVRIIGK